MEEVGTRYELVGRLEEKTLQPPHLSGVKEFDFLLKTKVQVKACQEGAKVWKQGCPLVTTKQQQKWGTWQQVGLTKVLQLSHDSVILFFEHDKLISYDRTLLSAFQPACLL